jgi:hypothetical protein
MSNASYFNPAFENQYLESNLFDGEIFENGEFGNPEAGSLEGFSLENPELSYEDNEYGEYGEVGNMEGDRFLGALGGLFGKIAPQIAQAIGGALAGETGAGIAQEIAENVLNEQQMEFSGELAAEGEAQLEAILESSGVSMEILGEMAHYAELAAETLNEGEADRFFGAIANLAGQILPGLLGETQMEAVSPESIANESVFEAEGDRFLPLLAAAAPMIGKAVLPMAKKLLPVAMKGVKNVVRNLGNVAKQLPPQQRKIVTKLTPAIAAKTAVRTANAIKKGAGLRPSVRRPVRANSARPPVRRNQVYRRPAAQGYASPSAPIGQGYASPSTPMGQTFTSSPAPINQVVAGAAARPIVETLVSPTVRQYGLQRNRRWAKRFRVTGSFTVSPY